MNWVDKFKAARRCSVPIIAIDTPDPAATIRTLCAASNGAPKLQYDLARGYRPLNEEGERVISDQGLDKVDNPVVAMKAAASVPTGSIIFVHNAHRFFKELAFLQPVWNLRDQFTGNRRMLVLLGPCLELPAEIRGDVIAIDDPLPDREAIRQIVQKVHDDAGVEPSEDSLASAGKALTGLPAFQVEQLTAMNLTPDGIALDGLWDAKAKQIKQTPGLSLHRGGTTFANLGGLGQLKDYFQRLMTGRQAPDVVVWLDEIEKSGLANTGDLSGTNSDQLGTVLSYMEDHKVYGTMLLGLPGTGKSEFCKAVGNEFERVVIRIDMGAMKGSLVGQSLRGDQELILYRNKGCTHAVRMTMKEFHDCWESGDREWFAWTYTEYGGKEVRRVSASIKHKRAEKFLRVKTKRGREIVVTEGHSLFVRKPGVHGVGRKESRQHATLASARADGLSKGDRIAIPLAVPSPDNPIKCLRTGSVHLQVTSQMMQLAGMWIGDGSWNRDMPRISCDSRHCETIAFLESVGQCTKYIKEPNGLDVTVNSKEAAAWLTIAGLRGQGVKSRTKRIPAWMFGCSNKHIGDLLRGYFNADGSFSGHVIEATTRSKSLAHDVVSLLGRFGILASLKTREVKRSMMYRIQISKGADVLRFREHIGFIESHKTATLEEFCRDCANTRRVHRDKSVFWDEIAKIEEIKSDEKFCYDISVPGTEKFVSGGVIVHNSEAQLREALKVVSAMGGENAIWIGTSNSMENLDSALQSRFTDVFFFDLPDQEERFAIWNVWCNHYEITNGFGGINDEGWVGRDIKQCCEKAYRMTSPLEEAARFIIPGAVKCREEIERLRSQAHNRYLSVTTPGAYREPTVAERGRQGSFS